MSIIKSVNEENHVSYDTEDSIYRLLYYIFDICKTSYDEVRPGHMLGDFRGCAHFLGTEEQASDPELVAGQMTANNRAYGRWKGNLLKHRIVSFDRWDCILPNEAFNLAAYIAQAYGERYITAYGVHVDTNNVHIHLAIDAVSWIDGRRFDISYELKWLRSMVSGWERKREQFLENEWDGFQRHWEYYGD